MVADDMRRGNAAYINQADTPSKIQLYDRKEDRLAAFNTVSSARLSYCRLERKILSVLTEFAASLKRYS